MQTNDKNDESEKNFIEAERLMTICNSCRYCEGLCAVFPAMEMRRRFTEGDLNYLANLCHNCGACYSDCQFSPPHEFAVNVPQTLAKLRNDTYHLYCWPSILRPLFIRNGLWISLIAALSIAAFFIGFALFNDMSAVFSVHTGPHAFYKLMPHNAMAVIFSAAFFYSCFAIFMGCRIFWKDIGEPIKTLHDVHALHNGVKDAATLHYLDGGGMGCVNDSEEPTDNRSIYHHLTFYGFLLCFAATCCATIWHYAFNRIAPYPWWDIPVVLGTLGGIGIIIGTIGLLIAKKKRLAVLKDGSRLGMDAAFILMLLLTGVTGMLLLVFRATPFMGVLLALHLGFVFGFFITLPYSKFVHGFYRLLALIRYAHEKKKL